MKLSTSVITAFAFLFVSEVSSTSLRAKAVEDNSKTTLEKDARIPQKQNPFAQNVQLNQQEAKSGPTAVKFASVVKQFPGTMQQEVKFKFQEGDFESIELMYKELKAEGGGE